MLTYQFNKETGKIHLNLDKKEYLSLNDSQKKDIKSYFLFSKTYGEWVSKSSNNSHKVKMIVKDLKLEETEPINEISSFEEKLNTKIEKSEIRVERFNNLSKKFSEQSTNKVSEAINMLSVIPSGQPILVGHHSEKHHRNLIDKSDNKMRAGIELNKKSEYYSERAKSSKNYGDTSKFENVQYVTERLKDNQKSLELFNNKFSPEQIKINAELNFKYNDYIDKINFFSKKLKELTEQGKVFNKESLKDKKFVKVRGNWELIVKLNKTTVAVQTPYSWTDKIPYEKITDSK